MMYIFPLGRCVASVDEKMNQGCKICALGGNRTPDPRSRNPVFLDQAKA